MSVFLGPLCGIVISTSSARAQTPPKPALPVTSQVPIGVSNVIVRLSQRDQIGLAGAKLRVQLIERLRESGFAGVGAENLVFDKDESSRAKFLLGGTVNELECIGSAWSVSCRVGVEWQLLDVERDLVVYTVQARSAVLLGSPTDGSLPVRLVLGALDSLLSRSRFRAALAPSSPDARPAFATAKFATCTEPGGKMPESADRVLRATVLIRSATGHGSGFFLTSDGLVMTAAHVLHGGTVRLRLKDGVEVEAAPVRTAVAADIALLRPLSPISGQACLPLGREPAVGVEVYAVGAPADQQLAFSLTRGIVSGTRVLKGIRQFQTDAAVSPGNSGGPLVDATGALIGVVTSKLAGGRVEGVSFSVPTKEALDAVGLTPGGATDPSLAVTPAPPSAPETSSAVVDTPDAIPSLDPEADRRREEDRQKAALRASEAERRAERDRMTPRYVKTLFPAGAAIAAVGAVAVLWSGDAYNEKSSTRTEFNTLRVYNTLGWLGVIGGTGAMIASERLTPPLPPPRAPKGARTVVIGPASISLRGDF